MSEHTIDDPQVAQLVTAAAEAQRRGDGAAVIRSFEQVLELDPRNALAHNALGLQALARDDLAEAERCFSAATDADPVAPPLWMNLATVRRRAGDSEGERASLLRAIGLDQRHFMANLRLAELHERLGESPQAAMRWNLVLGLAQMLAERPAGLEPALAHAQEFVVEHNRALADAVEAGLEADRAGLDGRERRRFDACVDAMLGRRRVFHNECAGLHFPFLPADEFFDRGHFPWLEDIEAKTDVIRAELEALITAELDGFSPYVSMDPGTPENKWSGLDKSLDWGAHFLWHQGERVEEACRRCPCTAEALQAVPQAALPGRAPTAFFSVLRPKTRLPAHTGVSNLRTIVHLPLIVPPGCGFRVGGEVREWRVGEAFAFDDTIEHEAWNDSDELRALLIFDVWNPYLTGAERGLLKSLFEVLETSGLNPNSAAVSD